MENNRIFRKILEESPKESIRILVNIYYIQGVPDERVENSKNSGKPNEKVRSYFRC